MADDIGQAALAARRFVLLLEYDGGGYAGSQLQKNAPTVQLVLEDAIETATGEHSRAAFAGRTDAGVHARGQVASFLSKTRLDADTLCRALNAWLPEDVAVLAVAEAPVDFEVRRDALRRHYRYVIDNRPARPALERERAWHVATPLDVEAMAEAARRLVGRRDFAAFAGRLERSESSSVRELQRFDVRRRGPTVVCDLAVNAFLPHQARRMVGALVDVGTGKRSVAEYEALLAGAPGSAGPAAPARGLYLMGVEYPARLFETGVQGAEPPDGGYGGCPPGSLLSQAEERASDAKPMGLESQR